MRAADDRSPEGWGWIEPSHGSGAASEVGPAAELCRDFHACFATPQGQAVLRHLQRVFLDRRVGPAAPDSELRHVEGQRSVVAYVTALVERARRDPREDRF